MIGQTISHYKIIEKLGEGGMGVVYRAEDTRLDRQVALKFLPRQSGVDEASKKRFIHEAKAAAALDHPNICSIFDVGETDDSQLFMAMAYYDGQTLKDKIAHRPLPIAEAIDTALQIAEGLNQAHKKGIVHRDIKSANIMITEEEAIKILDFGLAKLKGHTKLTKEGTTMGTVDYMSPEQVSGEETDPRTDIWSLGILLYEMVTGQVPFRGEYEQAVIYSILNEQPEPVTALRVGLPLDLDRIIAKALSKSPDERYQTMADFRVDLKRLKNTLSQPSQKDLVARPKINKRKRILYLTLMTIPVFIALVMLVIHLFHPGKDTVINSMAVLPLENITGDASLDYFADGMTEALISELAQVKSLRVISRTSVMMYKNKRKPLPEIARELNVDGIIEGTLFRAGDRVRITVQLIHGSDDRHLWADNYERNLTDVIQLQKEVALDITKQVRVVLTPEEKAGLTSGMKIDPRAYETYLRGILEFDKTTFESLNKSIDYFNFALEKEPDFARALAWKGIAYSILVQMSEEPPEKMWQKAREAAEKALSLDNTVAEAHAVMGYYKSHFQWDFQAADAELKLAIRFDPNSAIVRNIYRSILMARGLRDEALKQIQKASEIDPFSTWVMTLNIIMSKEPMEIKLEKAKKMVLNHPDDWRARGALWLLYGQGNQYDVGIKHVEKMNELLHNHFQSLSWLALALITVGKEKEAREILGQLKKKAENHYVSPACLARIYFYLNEIDQGFANLEKAYEYRDFWLYESILYSEYTSNDKIRHDPRYQDLLRRMGFESIKNVDENKAKALVGK